jgi:ketosteroid isomerase-like protein
MPNAKTQQLVEQFYDALGRGDIENVLDLCDPNVEVYKSPDVVAVIPPRGRDEVGRYLESWLETWDAYRPEPKELRESDDQVVSFIHLRARGKGSRFDMEEDVADVFRIESGKITSIRLYLERGQALEAAGLKE